MANSSNRLRSASSPSSGRTGAVGSDHFGPPTAPRKSAVARSHSASVAAGSGLTGRVDRVAADRALDEVEAKAARRGDRFEHAATLGDHLGPDAVAGKQDDARRIAHARESIGARRSDSNRSTAAIRSSRKPS